MNIRHILTEMAAAAFILAAMCGMQSCNHKDLCYGEKRIVKLRVAYDWSDAPDATPGGMCVFFYSTDDANQYYRFDFANTEGGEIELPEGRYRVITYNNDTEVVRFSSTNIFEGHMAYTRTGDLLEPMYGNGVTSSMQTDNGERVVVTPDGLWGCHAVDVDVDAQGVTYIFTRAGEDAMPTIEKDQVITLYPHDMLCHYSYEVRHVEGAEHINLISASLSGMAGSMTLSDEKLDTEHITLPVPGQTNVDTGEATGQFLTFGHSTSSPAPHKMTFYVVMDDGKKYVVKDSENLDVTSQVDDAPNPKRVHIIIDNIKLPQPTQSDEGFDPTVDDWGVKNEDLKI